MILPPLLGQVVSYVKKTYGWMDFTEAARQSWAEK